MRLIGAVNGYQDADMLRRSLPALRRVVDVLVYVDGAYDGFPPYSEITAASVDESVNVALTYADVVVMPPYATDGPLRAAWPDEVVKRSAYFVGGRDDYYLVVDADEVVEVLREDGTVNPVGKIDVATLVERDDWLVTLSRAGDSPSAYRLHRLFRHRDGIRYHGTHHAVHVGDPPTIIHPRGLEAEAPDSVFPRLRLSHLWNQRPQERVERKGHYYREVLSAREHEFRAANGLGR